jgi:hypothetical protein
MLIVIDADGLTDMADGLSLTAADYTELGSELGGLDATLVPGDLVSELEAVTTELRGLLWQLADGYGTDASDLLLRAELAGEDTSLYTASTDVYGASCCCTCQGPAFADPIFDAPLPGPGFTDVITGADTIWTEPWDDTTPWQTPTTWSEGTDQPAATVQADPLPFTPVPDTSAADLANIQGATDALQAVATADTSAGDLANIQGATDALQALSGTGTGVVDPTAGIGNYGFLVPGFGGGAENLPGAASNSFADPNGYERWFNPADPHGFNATISAGPGPASGSSVPLDGTDKAIIRASGNYPYNPLNNAPIGPF